MFSFITSRFAKNQSAAFVRGADTVVKGAEALGPEIALLSKEGMQARLGALRDRTKGDIREEADIAEAFALIREAGSRTLNERHFDVQLMGGLALTKGNIAEMRTGEGKTLVATLPAVVRALAGKGSTS